MMHQMLVRVSLEEGEGESKMWEREGEMKERSLVGSYGEKERTGWVRGQCSVVVK